MVSVDASVHDGIAALESNGLTVAKVGRPRVNLAERSVFDALVDGRNAVVKVDSSATRSAGEAGALRFLHQHGIPVPEVFHHLDGSPSVLVIARIDGAALTTHGSSSIWHEAGFVLRRIHAIVPGRQFAGSAQLRGEDIETWHESEIRRSRENGLLPPAQLHAVHSLLAPAWRNMADASPCLVHGDASAEHLLVGPDRRIAGVLDFGDMHIGDPVYDLAVLTSHHPGQLDAVLSGYRPGRTTRERVKTLLVPYRILRHLAVANWKYDNGLDPSPNLNALRSRVPAEPRTIRL
jgi:aminoglycoside phosphotransferase (APT) family kinase protein